MSHNQPQRVHLAGVPLDRVTFEETLDWMEHFIAEKVPRLICTVNLNQLYAFRRDPAFRAAYRRARLLVVDGRPLLWAAKALGKPLPAHVPGNRLLPVFAERAAAKRYRLFFLGAAPGVAEKAAQILQQRNPGLRVVGCYSPPYGFELEPVQNAETINRVRDASPDALFVALGAPKQEKWLAAHLDELGVPVNIGIGSTFDSLASRGKPAPDWATEHGLEWFYRFSLDPGRLWKRYMIENMSVLPHLLAQLISSRMGKHRA